MPDKTVDDAIGDAATYDDAQIRARLKQVEFLKVAIPNPASKGRLNSVTLKGRADLEALGTLIGSDVPRLLDLVAERGATIRLLASHRAADARVLDSVTGRAEDLRTERNTVQRCLRQLLDALQLLAARWQGPDFQSAYGDALLAVMRDPARYLEVIASQAGTATLAGGGRAVTRLLAERLAEHAHCDQHAVSAPEPGCGYCQDRAAYLAYLAAGGPDYRTPDGGGSEVPLSDLPVTCSDCQAPMPGDHRPGCVQAARVAAALDAQFGPQEQDR